MRYVILQKATVQPYVRYRKGHLERVRSYERMSEPTEKESTLPPDIKKRVNNEIHEKVTKQIYHDQIPLDTIFGILEDHGIVPLAEDNTEWSGFLLGREAHINFDIAPIGSKHPSDDPQRPFYKRFKNASLSLSWYKMPSGRYEILCHIG